MIYLKMTMRLCSKVPKMEGTSELVSDDIVIHHTDCGCQSTSKLPISWMMSLGWHSGRVVMHVLQNLGDRTVTEFLYPASCIMWKRARRQTIDGWWYEE